ncbi:type II toxin-antitoxin system HicB family antitoxin [Anaerococcus vaginalis]|uniref:type II toxin-antitoxin system HicB family antitoxin n=1 Tax=Anaerococcus vaginalis TaxID=33037 RepID=UPI002915C1CD|nr:type II toxin-antitoxin system HicB family antitoxin [Anaerococcus vaginalis]MDU5824006.1 type II toxin-antitoxin system HicB family antitoxin [Anaerococcus vaginalis]
MKQDRYSYPCIITFDKNDGIYYVNFPDLEDCFTDGETLEEALYNAKDVLGLVLYTKEENNIEINPPKNNFISTKENQALSYVSVWMPLVRDEIENKSIKKTITIPKWLNDLAEDNNVNFSKLLQVSLKKYLGV